MRIHTLKSRPEPFAAVENGSKTYEIRKDDRGYMVGDRLELCEWEPGDARSWTKLAVSEIPEGAGLEESK